jgi:hypothetical protein
MISASVPGRYFHRLPVGAPDEGGIGPHANSNTDLRLSAREICELA